MLYKPLRPPKPILLSIVLLLLSFSTQFQASGQNDAGKIAKESAVESKSVAPKQETSPGPTDDSKAAGNTSKPEGGIGNDIQKPKADSSTSSRPEAKEKSAQELTPAERAQRKKDFENITVTVNAEPNPAIDFLFTAFNYLSAAALVGAIIFGFLWYLKYKQRLESGEFEDLDEEDEEEGTDGAQPASASTSADSNRATEEVKAAEPLASEQKGQPENSEQTEPSSAAAKDEESEQANNSNSDPDPDADADHDRNPEEEGASVEHEQSDRTSASEEAVSAVKSGSPSEPEIKSQDSATGSSDGKKKNKKSKKKS